MLWVLLGMLAIVCILFYFLPTIIAACRGHGYTAVIFAINLAIGWTALGWLVALVWSCWPRERALVEPLVGNFTGAGYRNAGDAAGAVRHGYDRGWAEEGAMRPARFPATTAGLRGDHVERLERLASLKQSGALTEDEFLAEKRRLLGRS